MAAVDGDIAELEGLMDAWMNRAGHEGEGKSRSDELSTYVIAKISGKPLHLPRQFGVARRRGPVPRSSAVYGYQEPSRIERRSELPAIVPHSNKKEWDSSPSRVAWRDPFENLVSPPLRRKPKNQGNTKARLRSMQLVQGAAARPKFADCAVNPAAVAQPAESTLALELKTCESENRMLLVQVGQERAARAAAERRADAASLMIQTVSSSIERATNDIKATERVATKGNRQQQVRNDLLAAVRMRDRQIKELQQLIAAATRRMEALELQQDAQLRQQSVADEAMSQAPSHILMRECQHRNAALMKEYNALLARRNELVSQLNRAAVTHKDHTKKRDAIVAKMEREKMLAKLELERRLKKELEAEVARLRDNNEKASRFRHREMRAKQIVAQEAMKQLEGRLATSTSQSEGQTKELSNLRIQVATLKAAEHELQKKATSAEARVEELRYKLRIVDRDIVATRNAKISAEAEYKEIAHDKPSHDLAQVEAKHEKVRQQLGEKAAALQLQLNELLESRLKFEEAANLKEVSAQRITQLQSEISDLEKAIGDVDSQIVNVKKVEIPSLQKELAQLNERLQRESAEKDRTIEQWTNKKENLSSEFKVLNEENTRNLTQLDMAERMISMNNLAM